MTWAFVMAFATLFAQQTHWTKAEGFENNMNMSAVLYVDGMAQHLGQVEIGAFCGDECREAILPYEIDGEQVYLLTISGNADDVITFRLWDHQTDSELPYECITFYSFVANEVVGEYPEWYPIHFTIPDAVYGISATVSPEEGGTVTGGGTYYQDATAVLVATANEGYAFVNWTENDEVVSTEATYSFTVTGDRTLVANFVESQPDPNPEPDEVVITLYPGWNWISYLLTEETTLYEALVNLTSTEGDLIKGMGVSSMYYESSHSWMGSLTTLVPGQGYMYLNSSTEVKTFTYPSVSK